MSNYTLTLNRTHKVLERITVLRNQAQQDLTALIGKMVDIKPSELEPEKSFDIDMLSKDHNEKILNAFAKLDIYDESIIALKSTVIAKNVELGINSLISKLDCLNKSNQQVHMALINYSIRSEDHNDHPKMSQAIKAYSNMRVDLCKTDTGTSDFTRKTFKVALVSNKNFEVLEGTLKARKMEVDRVNDQIATLNGTKIDVNLPNLIAAEVGLLG